MSRLEHGEMRVAARHCLPAGGRRTLLVPQSPLSAVVACPCGARRRVLAPVRDPPQIRRCLEPPPAHPSQRLGRRGLRVPTSTGDGEDLGSRPLPSDVMVGFADLCEIAPASLLGPTNVGAIINPDDGRRAPTLRRRSTRIYRQPNCHQPGITHNETSTHST